MGLVLCDERVRQHQSRPQQLQRLRLRLREWALCELYLHGAMMLPCEEEMIAILDSRPRPGESIAAMHHRRECALGDCLARLSLEEAAELHRRLANPSVDDAIASRFLRLLSQRRRRLLTFLAEAPRRGARP